MAFFDYIKNIFILLLFLLFAPGIFEGIRTQYGMLINRKAKVGIVKVRGDLHHSSRLTKQLQILFNDPEIKAILVDIESCGGAAGAGQSLAKEIITLKKKHLKPIVTLTENICASGAYYMASATDYIISSGQALIGSIGSRMPYLFHINRLLEKYDIDYTDIKAGSYKGITDPFTALDEANKERLQAVVNDSYEQFVQDVAHNRKLAVQNAKAWADGNIFTGRQAKELGLVDELGSSSQAIAYIKDKQLIEGDIEWVSAAPSPSFLRSFLSQEEGDDCALISSATGTITDIFKKICLSPVQSGLV